mmetsp:Transcript_126044/g.368311  ORF Transcript_126044/g.368311 Transcript_126044/m.368311 type:complete len:264 (-) Transcript_126044:7-798(-)
MMSVGTFAWRISLRVLRGQGCILSSCSISGIMAPSCLTMGSSSSDMTPDSTTNAATRSSCLAARCTAQAEPKLRPWRTRTGEAPAWKPASSRMDASASSTASASPQIAVSRGLPPLHAKPRYSGQRTAWKPQSKRAPTSGSRSVHSSAFAWKYRSTTGLGTDCERGAVYSLYAIRVPSRIARSLSIQPLPSGPFFGLGWHFLGWKATLATSSLSQRLPPSPPRILLPRNARRCPGTGSAQMAHPRQAHGRGSALADATSAKMA